jgi:hypothetical protein
MPANPLSCHPWWGHRMQFGRMKRHEFISLLGHNPILTQGPNMTLLPQQYAPLVYGIIQAAITTAVATAIATYELTGLSIRFLEEWLFSWGLAFLAMLPVVVLAAPFIQRCVLALTVPATGD